MADGPGDYWDEYGRGPMQREFHRRSGYDPARHAAGFASWAKALKLARGDQPEWPDQFRRMLLDVVRTVLDAERAAVRADAEAWVEARLVPVREAYAALLERVKKLEGRAAARTAGNDNLRPPHVGVRATQAQRGPV